MRKYKNQKVVKIKTDKHLTKSDLKEGIKADHIYIAKVGIVDAVAYILDVDIKTNHELFPWDFEIVEYLT